MICKENLWGVVVWYNPTEANVSAIDSYINDIERLVVVDNSDNDNTNLLGKKPNVIYLPNLQNKGIAAALNQGCYFAIDSGAEWILTMDQDSHFNESGLTQLINMANQYKDLDKAAVFSPVHFYGIELKDKRKWKEDYTVEDSVMTSGNLLSLKAFKNVGGFREDFFIDLVDDEFCYRARTKGYQIVMINNVLLNHYLGDSAIMINFLGMKKVFDDHNELRHYYIARNMSYMSRLYPAYKKRFKRRLRKHFKRILLYDNRKKWKKLTYMIRGIKDYRKGVKGAYNH